MTNTLENNSLILTNQIGDISETIKQDKLFLNNLSALLLYVVYNTDEPDDPMAVYEHQDELELLVAGHLETMDQKTLNTMSYAMNRLKGKDLKKYIVPMEDIESFKTSYISDKLDIDDVDSLNMPVDKLYQRFIHNNDRTVFQEDIAELLTSNEVKLLFNNISKNGLVKLNKDSLLDYLENLQLVGSVKIQFLQMIKKGDVKQLLDE